MNEAKVVERDFKKISRFSGIFFRFDKTDI